MIKVNSQKDLDDLIALVDWEDAFLREWHLLSPEYVNPNNLATIAPDSLPTMLVLICTPEIECPCIELLFEEVEEIYFSCTTDLCSVANYRNDIISFSFHGDDSPNIISKSLSYRILDIHSWGWKVRYSKKNIFDQSGLPLSEDCQTDQL